MADKHPIRCKTTTSTAGTAAYVLDTAVLATAHRTPKQALADGSFSDGDTLQYMVIDTSVVGGGANMVELGEGVYDDATNTLTRVTIFDGSNGPGVPVSWPGSGVRDVLLQTMPSDRGARTDRANTFTDDQTIAVSDTLADLILSANSGATQWRLRANDTATQFSINDVLAATTPIKVLNGALTNSLVIDTTGVASGAAAASTNLLVQENNTDTTPTVEVEQLSTGDAGLMFSIVGNCYAMGVDNSDSDLFKMSYASGAGTAVLGTNDILTIDGATKNIGLNKNPSATSGTLLSIKSTGNGTSPVQIAESAGGVTIAAIQQSASGNGQLFAINSASTEFALLTTDTDPRLIFTTGGINRFEIGLDATDNKLKIENSQSAFSSPLAVIDASMFELNTDLHVQENNTDTVPAVEIEQLSTGDAALQLSITGRSYALGIDNSDSDKFKISTAAVAGTAVLGTNDLFVLSSAGVIDSIKSDTITNSSSVPYENFASGTKMVFYQSAAPTGWTKDTANNDAALRIVSGTGGGTGGSLALSSASVATHTLTASEIPAHTHPQNPSDIGIEHLTSTTGGTVALGAGTQQWNARTSTGSTGGGGSHTHGLALKYIDVIIAAKN